MLWKVLVEELQSVTCVFTVEAADAKEAKEKAAISETVSEGPRDIQDTHSRDVGEPVAIPLESS